ncbi:unnamed protein product, partial [Ectocarpus sp. 12 AP-2014]
GQYARVARVAVQKDSGDRRPGGGAPEVGSGGQDSPCCGREEGRRLPCHQEAALVSPRGVRAVQGFEPSLAGGRGGQVERPQAGQRGRRQEGQGQ